MRSLDEEKYRNIYKKIAFVVHLEDHKSVACQSITCTQGNTLAPNVDLENREIFRTIRAQIWKFFELTFRT